MLPNCVLGCSILTLMLCTAVAFFEMGLPLPTLKHIDKTRAALLGSCKWIAKWWSIRKVFKCFCAGPPKVRSGASSDFGAHTKYWSAAALPKTRVCDSFGINWMILHERPAPPQA